MMEQSLPLEIWCKILLHCRPCDYYNFSLVAYNIYCAAKIMANEYKRRHICIVNGDKLLTKYIVRGKQFPLGVILAGRYRPKYIKIKFDYDDKITRTGTLRFPIPVDKYIIYHGDTTASQNFHGCLYKRMVTLVECIDEKSNYIKYTVCRLSDSITRDNHICVSNVFYTYNGKLHGVKYDYEDPPYRYQIATARRQYHTLENFHEKIKYTYVHNLQYYYKGTLVIDVDTMTLINTEIYGIQVLLIVGVLTLFITLITYYLR
jgi:hypothetical protein